MKNTLKMARWGLLFGLVAVFFASCDEDETPEVLDIVETASADSRFTSLVAALTAADLVSTLQGAGPFTVFAPTDAAFADFLSANGFAALEDVPTDVLTALLLNHVVSGKVLSTDLAAGYVSSLATEVSTGNNISMLVNLDNGVLLNGSTLVTEADLVTSNGVIHVVDEVIAIPSVVDLALDNELFTTLVAALTRADLTADFVSILSADGPFTVFAPTNEAFTALLDSNPDWTALDDIPVATLEAVLSYHVVAGANVLSSTLTDGQEVTTFEGSNFTIQIDGSAVSILDGSTATTDIIATDVQGGNGVVHVVSGVLLP